MEKETKEKSNSKEAYGDDEIGDWIMALGMGRVLRWVRRSRHLKYSLLKIRLKRSLETTQGITMTKFLDFNFNVIFKKANTLFNDISSLERKRGRVEA